MAFCGFLYEEGRPVALPSEGSSLNDSNVPLDWEDEEDLPLPDPDALQARQRRQTVANVRVHSDTSEPDGTVVVTAAGSNLAVTGGNLQQEQDPLAQSLLRSAAGQAGENVNEGRHVGAGLKQQMQKLWITLNPAGPTQGVVLSAVVYIFLTWAVVPDVGTGATYYFYTGKKSDGGLQFGDVTYSMLSVVGDIAMLGASYIYGAYLGSTPLRKLFIGLQLLNVAASALDLALALHWNERLGISAAAFAGLGKSAVIVGVLLLLLSWLTQVGVRVPLLLLLCRVEIAIVPNICTHVNLCARICHVDTDSAVYFLAWQVSDLKKAYFAGKAYFCNSCLQLKNLPVYTLAAKVCPPGAHSPTRWSSLSPGQALRCSWLHGRRGGEPDSLHCGDERSLRLGGTILRSVADDAMWRDSGRFQASLGYLSSPDGLQAHSDPIGATRAIGKLHSCLTFTH